jgi:ribonuclease D
MQTNSKYILIDNKKSMELAAVNLSGAKSISIDTESSGYFTYYSRICLVQISVNGKNYIIDPLAPLDMALLNPIFENEKILKIFHSAPDDVKGLKRDFSYKFKNIADTMYSSKLLGMEHNSLNYLVEFYHSIKLSKTEQKSNWEKRPLDKQQLQYAALDTAYLESIWEKMEFELRESQLLEEAISEFKKMTEELYKGRESTGEISWHKFPNILKFTPEQRRSVYDVLSFREEKAKKLNKAPFRVINNETISKIIFENLKEEEIINLLGRKDGSQIAEIVKNPSGSPLNKSDFPRIDNNMTTQEESKLRHLHKWRDKIIKKRGVDHSMILSNKQLLTLIRNPPTTLEELDKSHFLSDWKLQNYGITLLKALHSEPYDDLLEGLIPIKRKK